MKLVSFMLAALLVLSPHASAAETPEDAAVVRAVLDVTGRASCLAPKRQGGSFATLRSHRARDEHREALIRHHETFFRLWGRPDGSGWADKPTVDRLAAASARLLAGPVGSETPDDFSWSGGNGPCDGLAVTAIEWMDGLAFVEISEWRAPRDGRGTLWAFERDGKDWRPVGFLSTWVT